MANTLSDADLDRVAEDVCGLAAILPELVRAQMLEFVLFACIEFVHDCVKFDYLYS